MNVILTEFRASLAFVYRNFNLVKRYAAWESVFLVYNVVNVLTIGYIGYGDPEKILYLIIGSLLWGFLSVLFHDVADLTVSFPDPFERCCVSVMIERDSGSVQVLCLPLMCKNQRKSIFILSLLLHNRLGVDESEPSDKQNEAGP